MIGLLAPRVFIYSIVFLVYVTDPDKAVRIDEERREDDPLNDHKIYVSSEDIQSMGLEHLFTNGMFNDTDTAIVNQQTQQGYADGVLNYNQQHGVAGDMIENIQDHLTSNLGLGSLGTGSSHQTGEVIEQMTSLNNGNVVIGAHSQGTMMTQNGLDQQQENLAATVQANPSSVFQVQYSGAPVNYHVGAEMITSIYGGKTALYARTDDKGIDSVFRSHVAPQDSVGTVLGANSAGVNNSENLGANIIGGLIGAPLLFGIGGASPHSYYPCIIGCGDERSTPVKNYFYENNDPDNQEVPLTNDYTTRLPHVNQGLLPQSTQVQQNTPQTQLDTTGGK